MAQSQFDSAVIIVLFLLGTVFAIQSASGDIASSYSVNCTRLPNGKYVRGCSANFTVCANGEAAQGQCLYEQVMNPVTGLCQARVYTAICAHAKDEMKLFKVSAPLDCSSAAYGSYPWGYCTRHFKHCGLGGEQIEMNCPPGLVYDHVSGEEPICNLPEKCVKAMAAKRPWEALVVAEPAPEPVTIATPTSTQRPSSGGRRSGQVLWPIDDEARAGDKDQDLGTGMQGIYESRLRAFTHSPTDANYQAAMRLLELTEKVYDLRSKQLAYVVKLSDLMGKLTKDGSRGKEKDKEDGGMSLDWLLAPSPLLNTSLSDFARQPTDDNYDAAMGVLALTQKAYEVRAKELAYVEQLSDAEEKLVKAGFVKEGRIDSYITAFVKRYNGDGDSVKKEE